MASWNLSAKPSSRAASRSADIAALPQQTRPTKTDIPATIRSIQYWNGTSEIVELVYMHSTSTAPTYATLGTSVSSGPTVTVLSSGTSCLDEVGVLRRRTTTHAAAPARIKPVARSTKPIVRPVVHFGEDEEVDMLPVSLLRFVWHKPPVKSDGHSQ